MNDLIKTAEKFGRIIWPIKRILNVDDLMLFGGLVSRKPVTKDVDLLVIHHNPKFDLFEDSIKRMEYKSPEEALQAVYSLFNEEKLKERLNGTEPENLALQGLFQTIYMNNKYFQDGLYKRKWDSQNANPQFSRNIFRKGKLWNPRTQKYDIPAKTKYNLNQCNL